MQTLRSTIHTGKVTHSRTSPVRHDFVYSVYFYCLWLDELEALDKSVMGFGYNRFRSASIYDRDYLKGEESQPILPKLKDCIHEFSSLPDPSSVLWITSARYFNHVFNPVSFYVLFGEDKKPYGLVAEVNNTFGDRHLYITELTPEEDGVWIGKADKGFHVSPFYNLEGEYEFILRTSPERVSVDVNLKQKGEPTLFASIEGKSNALTTKNLTLTMLRFPLSASLTVPRIIFQAYKLRFKKRLDVYRRPEPTHPMTIKHKSPDAYTSFCRKKILEVLKQSTKGSLLWKDFDGHIYTFGDSQTEPEVTVEVHHPSIYKGMMTQGDIALGEAYMRQDIKISDTTKLVEFLIRNRSDLERDRRAGTWLGKFQNVVLHVVRRNSVRNSRKNIQAHYDLSNEFFALFLDPTMSYSSALYRSPTETLEQAQQNKLHALILKARIRPDHHVLEIGTGWGALAIEMVRQTGCKVTSITLSREQLILAKQKVHEAGLSEYIDIQLCDYRDVKGQFDRVVSVEMIEAVGHQFLPTYLKRCEEMIKPNGLVVLQAITIPDQRYERYRRGCDFIQKHIFPGGHLPSLNVIGRLLEKHTSLHVSQVDNIGPHYAPTLKAWKEAFIERKGEVLALGFDLAFYCKWLYYFGYCEAAFSTGTLNVLHLVLSPAGNQALLDEAELLFKPSKDESVSALSLAG